MSLAVLAGAAGLVSADVRRGRSETGPYAAVRQATAPPGAPLAGPHVFTVDPRRTAVTFQLEATGHDVAGTFAAPSGSIRFDPATGEASGAIRLELRGAATGNASRDRTMHEKVFETDRFPVVTFTAKQLRGSVVSGTASDVVLSGTLNIHGEDHDVTLPARVVATNDRLGVDATFEIPFVAWGMHDPSWFVLRVGKTVKVAIKADGPLAAVAP